MTLQSLKSILERIPTATGLKDSKIWACLTTKKNVQLVRPFPEIQKLCATLHTLSESFYLQDITIYYPSGNYHWIHSKIFKSLLLFCRVTNIDQELDFQKFFNKTGAIENVLVRYFMPLKRCLVHVWCKIQTCTKFFQSWIIFYFRSPKHSRKAGNRRNKYVIALL